jgi:hypothetical protein
LTTLTPLVSMLAPAAIFQGRALDMVKLGPNFTPPPPTVRPCEVTLWLALSVTVPGPSKKNPPELDAVTVALTWMLPGPPKVTLCWPGPLALLMADAMVTPAELVERMRVSEPVPEMVPPLKVMPWVPVKSKPLVGLSVPLLVMVTVLVVVLSTWSVFTCLPVMETVVLLMRTLSPMPVAVNVAPLVTATCSLPELSGRTPLVES